MGIWLAKTSTIFGSQKSWSELRHRLKTVPGAIFQLLTDANGVYPTPKQLRRVLARLERYIGGRDAAYSYENDVIKFPQLDAIDAIADTFLEVARPEVLHGASAKDASNNHAEQSVTDESGQGEEAEAGEHAL